MKKNLFPLVATILVLLCVSCNTTKKSVKSEKFPLVGTQWSLFSLEGEEISNDFALRPFITFDSTGQIQGNLGCNTFFGNYSVNKKHKMTISYQGSTKRLCGQMKVERQFITALKRDINSYQIKDEELILSSDGEEIMRFKGVNLNEVE